MAHSQIHPWSQDLRANSTIEWLDCSTRPHAPPSPIKVYPPAKHPQSMGHCSLRWSGPKKLHPQWLCQLYPACWYDGGMVLAHHVTWVEHWWYQEGGPYCPQTSGHTCKGSHQVWTGYVTCKGTSHLSYIVRLNWEEDYWVEAHSCLCHISSL